MNAMCALSRPGPFSLAAAALLSACVAVRYTPGFAATPDLAAWGITFDLTISIPLLYWFFVVRTGKAQALTIIPVFLLGSLVARLLLPTAQQVFVRELASVVLGVGEAVLAATLARRVIALKKQGLAAGDPYERISAAARALLGHGRVAEIVASEVAMVYYALFTWRQRPDPRERSVTFHERNGWGTVVAFIFVLIVAEGLAMHLLLSRWSAIAAWAWTALDLWAMLWFLGDFQALRLRRTWLNEQGFHVRYGLRWSVTIPRDLIVSFRAVQNESDWKRRDVLKISMLEDPRWLITLGDVTTAHGLAGMRKEIRALALSPDQEEWIADLVEAGDADRCSLPSKLHASAGCGSRG